ncbi:MAG: 30S ribosomal protein S8 [Candidatus Ratteibacteria bacterium]|nr:30S ribosomal protein S8 [Candidatus Ratteibacteria bacterium]
MSITDPIADFVVALKNASLSRKTEIIVTFSNMKMGILQVLKKEGFIDDYTSKKEGNKNNITVKLKYFGSEPAIRDAKKVSKISKKVYVGKDAMPAREGNRIWIISTSQGIITSDECKEKDIGGELLCYVE